MKKLAALLLAAYAVGGGRSSAESDWTCSVDDVGAALTTCQAAPRSQSGLHVTSLIAASTTGTSGQMSLAYGNGPNCAYGTMPLLPAAAYTPRLSYPLKVRFKTPLVVPVGQDLCVIGTDTNTVTVQISGTIGAAPQTQAPAWTPLDLSPWGWWEADNITDLADAEEVVLWSDMSGNSRDLVSSTGLAPAFKAGIQHGLPVVRFSAGQFMGTLQQAFLGTNGAGTIGLVVIPSSADLEYVWRDAGISPTAYLAWLGSAGPAIWACANDGSLVCAQPTTTAAAQMVVWSKAATTVAVGIGDWDTAALTSASAGSLAPTGEFILSDWSGGSPGALGFKGDIAAVCVVSSTLTEENRRRLADYWLRKWFGKLSGDTTRPTW